PMSLTRMSGCHCSTCSNASSALAADMTSAPEGSQHHAHELARVGLVVNDQNAQTLEDSRPDDLAVQRAARRFWLEAADAGGGQREIDREGRPAIFPRAFGTRDTPMEFDDVPHDGEPESEAAMSTAD